MRVVLSLLFVCALALPASAQARFVTACVASADGGAALAFDPGRVCECSAARLAGNGVAASDLDRLVDVFDQVEAQDLSAIPDDLRPVASATIDALVGCALADVAQSTAASGAQVAAAASTPAGLAADGAFQPGAAQMAPPVAVQAPVLAPGLSTGNGTAPARTQQHGAGAVIRIVG